MSTFKKERKKSYNFETIKLLKPQPHERKFSDHFNKLDDYLSKPKEFPDIVIPDTKALPCKPSINVNYIDQEEEKKEVIIKPKNVPIPLNVMKEIGKEIAATDIIIDADLLHKDNKKIQPLKELSKSPKIRLGVHDYLLSEDYPIIVRSPKERKNSYL